MSLTRLVSTLVGLTLIVIAAAGFQLSRRQDNFRIIRGTVGNLSPYNQGTAGVSDVRVATQLDNGSSQVSTTGMFVVVHLTVQAPKSAQVHIQRTQLRSQHTTYTSFGLGDTVFADPGFQTSRDVAYEVDPRRIDDLTAEVWDTQIVVGYQQRLRVHLGITASNAPQWVAAAQGQRIRLDHDETTRGLP